jgi:hypothetical protein
MRLETLDETLTRLNLSRETIKGNLLRLNALGQEASALIGNADSAAVNAFDYAYLGRNGYGWVIYRGKCYPFKPESKRYLGDLPSAERLKQIEKEIGQIDDTYNPDTQCVLVSKKYVEREQSDSRYHVISI